MLPPLTCPVCIQVCVCVCASVHACVFTDHLTMLAGVAVLDLTQRGRGLKVLSDEDF